MTTTTMVTVQSRSPADVAKLVLRIIALNLVAVPAAFVGALGISIALVFLTAVFPPKDTRLLGAAIGIGVFVFIGPGLVTGSLILSNRFAEDRRLNKRDFLRALVWGGGLILLAYASTQMEIVPWRTAGQGFWLIPIVPFAIAAEILRWP